MDWSELLMRFNTVGKRGWIAIFVIAFLLSAWFSMAVSGGLSTALANLVSYLVIPPLAWCGGALAVYLLSRAIRQPLGLERAFLIVFGSSIFLQVLEPMIKIVIQSLPEQAAILYFVFYIPLSIAVYAYALKRWGPYRWAAAIFLALANGVSILAFGGMLTVFLGS